MSTYVIGDVQGCFTQLEALVAEVGFRENKDQLWFAGDLINRGAESLETLRFVKKLGSSAPFPRNRVWWPYIAWFRYFS